MEKQLVLVSFPRSFRRIIKSVPTRVVCNVAIRFYHPRCPVFRIRIRIWSGPWIRIRIQEGKNDPQKYKKVNCKFWSKKYQFFSIFGHKTPGSGFGLNESGSETLQWCLCRKETDVFFREFSCSSFLQTLIWETDITTAYFWPFEAESFDEG